MIQLNWYQIFGQSIPDGRTVTPTDDIQIWLHCGNIWDKNYTTLAQVLADTDTLVALMASDNAVDYLVRSTSFIYGVGTVPAMTSATTPSGTVGGSLTSAGHEAYKAFDGDDTTYALRSGASSGGVDYTYNQAENIKAMYVFNASSVSLNFTIYYKETAESANTTASSTIAIPSNSGKYIHTTSDNISGVLWGAYAATGSGTADLKVSTVQFYNVGIVMSEIAMKSIGASDYASTTLLSDSTWCDAIHGSTYSSYVENASVPAMTSNTTPSGTASGTATQEGDYYKAFDKSTGDYWYGQPANPEYVQYDFGYPVSIFNLYMFVRGISTAARTWNVKYQGSNDNITYFDLTESFDTTAIIYTESFEDTKKSNVTTPVRYVRFVVNTNYYTPTINVLQFYGRQNGGVQTWLHTAGITNKNYTTLSEVLADTSTLSTLINNHSACDYLVTCTGWATTICADSNAMTYIGQNNYCANKLLADATWRAAIFGSTYRDSIINAKVPNMTSATTPSGEVFVDVVTTMPIYYIFDGDTNVVFGWSQNTYPHWFAYDFGRPVRIYGFNWWGYNDYVGKTIPMKLEYSDDKSTWNAYGDTINAVQALAWSSIALQSCNASHRYWRIYCATQGTANSVAFKEVQFYGREDV